MVNYDACFIHKILRVDLGVEFVNSGGQSALRAVSLDQLIQPDLL